MEEHFHHLPSWPWPCTYCIWTLLFFGLFHSPCISYTVKYKHTWFLQMEQFMDYVRYIPDLYKLGDGWFSCAPSRIVNHLLLQSYKDDSLHIISICYLFRSSCQNLGESYTSSPISNCYHTILVINVSTCIVLRLQPIMNKIINWYFMRVQCTMNYDTHL